MSCMDNIIYDLIILGAGPAGTAAGVYAQRKGLKTLVVADGFGGQAVVAAKIENIIGHPVRAGIDLAMAFERHLKAVGVEIVLDKVKKIEKENAVFKITTNNEEVYSGKNVLVALGSQHKHLGVPGEDRFQGRGVVYCSTCDAPLFKNKIVAVVGGGNSGINGVFDLLPYAEKIYLLEFADHLAADQILQDKIMANSKVEVILNAKALEIIGEKEISGIVYEDLKNGEKRNLSIGGVFVHIGMKPNSDIFDGLLDVTSCKEIIVDPITGRTSLAGVWAAGDITNLPYKQINIAMGDAIRATLDIVKTNLEK